MKNLPSSSNDDPRSRSQNDKNSNHDYFFHDEGCDTSGSDFGESMKSISDIVHSDVGSLEKDVGSISTPQMPRRGGSGVGSVGNLNKMIRRTSFSARNRGLVDRQ